MESSNRKLISAKDISLRFKIPYPTVNHYTNLGFLPVVKRKGNIRLYEENQVSATLEKISRWKDDGYPLRLISKLLRDSIK